MIKLEADSSQGIKQQIKGGIKALIRSGKLTPGQKVLSSRELAESLEVNRNTTWAAYRELAAEGWLVSHGAKGTTVAVNTGRADMSDLRETFAQALNKASELGLSWRETSRMFQDFAQNQAAAPGCRLLLVECNPEGLAHIGAALARRLGAEPAKALIQDLEKNGLPEGAGFELVVSGFNHLAQMRELFPELSTPMMGVMLKPDLAVMSELITRPKAAKVGMVCVNHLSTFSLFRQAIEGGGDGPGRVWAGLEEKDRLKEMFANCPVVYASSYAYDRVAAMAPPEVRVERVELTVDAAGLEAVAAKAAELVLARA